MLDDALERARARARDPEDLAHREAHRFVLDNFGGCWHRAAAFMDEKTRPID